MGRVTRKYNDFQDQLLDRLSDRFIFSVMSVRSLLQKV